MEELYRENAKIVYFYIFRQCKNHDLAEEITQETFLRAMNCVETFPMVLPILIIAAFLTAGSARAFTKKKACLCAISCILLFCEFLLMRTAFIWVTEETLPFGMKTEHIGPFIRNLLLVMMVCELVILIYSIVYGRLKNTDNTYCAAISVTGVILSLSYINLLKRLENVDRFLSSVNQIMIFLTAELIILLVSYVIIGRFRKM